MTGSNPNTHPKRKGLLILSVLLTVLILTILLLIFYLDSSDSQNTPETDEEENEEELYSEDFEDNEINDWNFDEAEWTIVTDEITDSLVCTSSEVETAYASIGTSAWADYLFSIQARRNEGAVNLYFRVDQDNGYALRIEAERLVVWTERSVSEEELASSEFAVGTDWHTYTIEVVGQDISISVDEDQIISFTDDEDASLSGGIAVEIISQGQAYLDNILVMGQTSDGWEQTNGPNGGVINSIEIDPNDPNILYIGGVGGFYTSTDAGETWTKNSGFPTDTGDVSDILLNPEIPSTLYVLAGKLYKSTDSGETWHKLFDGGSINCAAMNQTHPEQLLIGNSEGQIWLSKDNGDTWENVSGDLPGYSIKTIAFGKENEIWAGTEIVDDIGNGGLYHSDDSGDTWSLMSLDQADTSEIHTIFVDPNDQDRVYVGLRDINNEMFDQENDIYLVMTEDAGTTWATLQLPFTDAMVNVIGFNPINSILYVGTGGSLYSSDDLGQTWEDISPEGRNGDMYDLVVNPDDPDLIYLPRRAYGMVKSENGGKDWTPINTGLLNTTVSLLALGNDSGSTIYASSVGGEGTFKSTDYGETWENITSGGITHPWADEMTVSPLNWLTIWEIADVGNIYTSNDGGISWEMIVQTDGEGFRAGTITASAIAASDSNILYTLKSGFGIFKSTDSGNSWDFLHSSEVDYTYSLVVNPDDADILFSGDTPKPFQDRARVQRTVDGGETWDTVLTVEDSTGITSIAIDPQDTTTIYASSTGDSEDGGGQIYQSIDNGETWSELNEHFTMLTVWGQPQLVGDPTDPDTVYVATWLAGTWKTTDAGETWEELTDAPVSSTSLSIDPQDSQVIYSTDRTAPTLWKSTDGGITWSEIADFSDDNAFLLNRVLVTNEYVYAATFGPGSHDGKLYRSADEGETWEDITNELPRSVLDIAVDPSDEDHIYVTTHIYGAYQSEDGGKSWQEIENFPDIGAYDIEIDPTSPDILYAAGLSGSVPDWVMEGGYTFDDSAGVYKSEDGGKTWEQILETSNECRAIRISSSDHNMLFASSLTDGFFISLDGGETWTNDNLGLDSTNLTSLWVSEDKVYVGTQGFGVYSGDLDTVTGDVDWIAERSNKPIPDVYNIQIEVDPSNSQRIYVSSNPGGLYRSDDGGETWYDKNFTTPSVVVDDPVRQGYYVFAINPEDTEEVWVGTWGKGIYKSYDGQDYNISANGNDYSMYGKHFNELLFSSELGVIAATEEGVFYTQDGGETWVDWSEGLETTQIRTIDRFDDGTLLCGTAGYELYTRSPGDSEWRQVNALGNFGTFWPIWNDRPLYQYSQLLFDQEDQDTIYLGTFPEGIFKSTDGGESWVEKNVGWSIDGVFTLEFSPSDSDVIYAGTYNGISRSVDAGEHWEMWNSGWPGEQWVFSIAFDPNDSQIMYACSKNGENEGTGSDEFHGTVMKSTDGGANWTEITQGLDKSNEFYKIIVDKFDSDTLYLATQYDGVMVSYNAGESWQSFNEGLTNLQAGTNGNNVTNTMVLSEDGTVLYFGTAGSGVFRRYLTSSADE